MNLYLIIKKKPLLFIQLPQAIRSRNDILCTTHIQFHTGFPGPLAQRNEKIGKLLIKNVLKVSKFYEKYHV